ncbi:MAG: hypothetical protein GY821_07710, partial [Gammaproteobacteria bacterium]|nr:hypothetical protein [Gammaproteobacteria bacterium]
MSGTLGRLAIDDNRFGIEPAEIGKHGEIILPKLTHVYVHSYIEQTVSLLGWLGLLAPNLEMLKIHQLLVRGHNNSLNGDDGHNNESEFSYADFVRRCSKLRHLTVMDAYVLRLFRRKG